MKKLYNVLLCIAVSVFLLSNSAWGQCPAGYTNAAQLNWDNLDYYYNSGSNVAPYGYSTPSNGNYVSNTMEQTQRFAVGTNAVTIATSAAGIVKGENALHTGELAGYTGKDAQYTPTANGQTITITFDSEVRNFSFSLYDIDGSSRVDFAAVNALSVAQLITLSNIGGTLTPFNNGLVNPYVTSTATDQATTSNNGSVTVTVGALLPVKRITITLTTIGTNPIFWLSDINACVANAFPTNYHQGANNRPFVGPTQNMPDYFLVTPDNDSAYMVDPATATARYFFNDPAKTYVNSFGYDPYNRFLYYITENPSLDYTNKQVKRYDYNTETSSVIIADITAAPFNIPTMNGGVESAACSFYDGALYFGIEGGTHSTGGGSPTITTRKTIVYRIDFDVSNNPTGARQVFATDASTSGSGTQTSIHDWGDFIIKDGVLYDFNTARNSCGGSCSDYTQSKFHHYNMMTGQVTNVFNNPTTANWNGQAGMTWAQNLYYFRASTAGNSVVGTYDAAGNCGAPQTITKVGPGQAWPGGAGDASDPFRPKCDFGDAPASYDPYVTPATQSPAVHERADTMWLGNTTVESTSWSREFLKRGVNGTADSDNGLTTVPILQPGTSSYLIQASLYNNSSGNATAIAWLDFNGNGTFDAAEAAQVYPAGASIPPGAAVVTRYFYWPSVTTPLLAGSSTYLRIRITATAAGMTTSHPTGYFEKGEVEDYRVVVDNYPLATHLLSFNAALEGKKVKLNWSAVEETGIYSYDIERSADNNNWSVIGSVDAHNMAGTFDYQSFDANPLKGTSYYRLKIIESTGMNRYSAIRPVTFNEFNMSFTIAPNPAKERTQLLINANETREATIELLSLQGTVVLSKSQRLNKGTNAVELLLTNNITAGLYIIRVKADSEIIHQKLIVNR